MADATIGSLRVVLGADTAKLEDDLKKAGGSISKFGKHVLEIFTGIKLAQVFDKAIEGVIESFTRAVDAADKLGKASQKFGVPVEQLSALTYAAELSDVSLEQLGKSVARLNRNMIEVAAGGTQIAASAFAALGIKVKDASGTLKTTDAVLLEVAEKFSKFEDGATKSALAQAIFGKSGADLIPFLNQGAAGIAKLTEEAKRLGIVIGKDTTDAAEQFNDSLKTLGKTKDAIILKIAGSSGLLAAMGRLNASLIHSVEEANKFERAGDLLGTALDGLRIYVDALTFSLSFLTLPFRAIIAAFVNLAQGDFAGAWKAITDRVGGTVESFKEMVATLNSVRAGFKDTDNAIDSIVSTLKRLDELRAQQQGKAPLFDPDAAKRAQQFAQELVKIGLQTREVAGDFTGKLAPGFIGAAQSLKLISEDGKNLNAILSLSTKQAKQLNDALFGLEGAKLTQEFLTPWQLYEDQLKRIDALLARNAISADVASKAGIKAAADLAHAYGTAAQGIVSPMADAFKSLAAVNKKYAGIAKAAAIAEATINTFVAATKALAQGGVLGFATAAAVTAAGLANVAKISATEFARGGSFRIGGGMAGIDSKFVQFKGAPGEIVDVRRPEQESRDASRGTQTIEVRGMRSKDFFTGEMVRNLIDGLNAAGRDGYRLKVVG